MLMVREIERIPYERPVRRGRPVTRFYSTDVYNRMQERKRNGFKPKHNQPIQEQSFKVVVASAWYDLALDAGYVNAKYQLHDSVIVFKWHHKDYPYKRWKKQLQILDCFNARRDGKLLEFMYRMLCNAGASNSTAVLRKLGVA